MEEFFKSAREASKKSISPLAMLAAVSGKSQETLAPLFEPIAAIFEELFCGPYPPLQLHRVGVYPTIEVSGPVEAADLDLMARGFIGLGCHDLAAELALAAATCPQIATPHQVEFVSLFLGIEGNSSGQLVDAESKLRLAGHAAFLSKFEGIELAAGHPWKPFFDSIDPVALEAAHRAGHRRAFGELLSRIVEAYDGEAIKIEELIALLKRFKDEAVRSRIEQLRVDVLLAVRRVSAIAEKRRKERHLAAINTAFKGFKEAVRKMKGYQLLDLTPTSTVAQLEKLLAQTGLPDEFDVNLKGISGHTALQRAIRDKKLDIARWLLLQPGINPNVTDSGGYTLLQTCVIRKRHAVVKMLLTHPEIGINARTPGDRDSPLHAAIRNDDVEMVKLLLAHPQVDVNLVATGTPLDCAIEQGNKDIIQMLKARKAVSDSEAFAENLD